MVAINSIILAVSVSTISAVSVFALPAASEVNVSTPSTYESLNGDHGLTARSFDGGLTSEAIMMLMHCNLSKDGQILSQFSDIGLYDTIDSSRDGSIPAHYVGPNSIQGLTDFSAPKNANFNDGRGYISEINGGGFNVPAFESIGKAKVTYTQTYPENGSQAFATYHYDCFRDSGRLVFGANAGDNLAECYAFGYCTFQFATIAA
ncbi:hypothetical protein HDU97_004778 [Phlyctochytrium planicorne]|nr:hypothetical protein HDU97_004778 [Phlyctochytrium planicorne]